jgi:MFS-type transporter involved in bile tolerance (Atg22 family)
MAAREERGCALLDANVLSHTISAEIYVFGAFFGLQLGSIQSYSRTLFSQLIPEGHEAEFFAFFEITDKGSSWLGPLVVSMCVAGVIAVQWGWAFNMLSVLDEEVTCLMLVPPHSLPLYSVVHVTGQIRWAMLYLTLFFIIPLPLLYYCDVEKGIKEARDFVKHIT